MMTLEMLKEELNNLEWLPELQTASRKRTHTDEDGRPLVIIIDDDDDDPNEINARMRMAMTGSRSKSSNKRESVPDVSPLLISIIASDFEETQQILKLMLERYNRPCFIKPLADGNIDEFDVSPEEQVFLEDVEETD